MSLSELVSQKEKSWADTQRNTRGLRTRRGKTTGRHMEKAATGKQRKEALEETSQYLDLGLPASLRQWTCAVYGIKLWYFAMAP
jgi:hypothetical protein